MAQHVMPGEIGEHMPVVGSDGQPVGTVDRLEGDRLKLTRDGNGQHHFLPRDAIASVAGGQARLSMTAAEAKTRWQGEAMPSHAGTPAMTGATQGQRSLLGAAEAGRGGGQHQGPGGQRQGGSEVGGMAGQGGGNDATGGTGMTNDPI